MGRSAVLAETRPVLDTSRYSFVRPPWSMFVLWNGNDKSGALGSCMGGIVGTEARSASLLECFDDEWDLFSSCPAIVLVALTGVSMTGNGKAGGGRKRREGWALDGDGEGKWGICCYSLEVSEGLFIQNSRTYAE